jgi:hypothetical protein
MEVRIPFKDLGLTNSNMSQIITLQNYSLGNQVLSTSGGSKGPFVLTINVKKFVLGFKNRDYLIVNI